MPKKYGPIGLSGYRAHEKRGEHLHVLINGEDVTRRCVFADDVSGVVELLSVNDQGRHYFDRETQDVAMETRTGSVIIKPGEPFA